MYIDCLWVAGSFKGNGYSNDLLNACIEDSKAKGKKGICILSAAKKKLFLADPKFLKYKDFTICDEADNGIQLWYLPFSLDAAKPEFKECAKHPHIEQTGYVLYYTNQCPFNAKYVPVLLEVARERGVPFQATRLETKEEAQNAPTPVTTYALFYNGEYLTNEQMPNNSISKRRNRRMRQRKMKQRKSKQSKSLAKILTLGIAAATVVSSMSVPGGLLAPETVYADDNTGAAESGDQGTEPQEKPLSFDVVIGPNDSATVYVMQVTNLVNTDTMSYQ